MDQIGYAKHSDLAHTAESAAMATRLYGCFADAPAATRARMCRSEAARLRASAAGGVGKWKVWATAASILETKAECDEVSA